MATPLVTRSDWLASHPPDASRLTATLAGVAHRVVEGEDFRRRGVFVPERSPHRV